jgi:hypothetical protein
MALDVIVHGCLPIRIRLYDGQLFYDAFILFCMSLKRFHQEPLVRIVPSYLFPFHWKLPLT